MVDDASNVESIEFLFFFLACLVLIVLFKKADLAIRKDFKKSTALCFSIYEWSNPRYFVKWTGSRALNSRRFFIAARHDVTKR